jgi:hypothetical protein
MPPAIRIATESGERRARVSTWPINDGPIGALLPAALPT